MGKAYAARAAHAANKKDAEAIAEEGLEKVAAIYKKGATAVDGLKDMAKQLRRLPVVDISLPTVRTPQHVGLFSAQSLSIVDLWTRGQRS